MMNRHSFGMDPCWDRRFGGRGRSKQEGEPATHGGRGRGGFERGFGEPGGPDNYQRGAESGPEGAGREFGGHRWGGMGRGFAARVARGFGEGRGRLFDAGDVKLVILKLLSEQPSYGYQLIKTMEQRLAGGYTPSAGVIYPTLTLLEEEGLATSTTENNKKVYSLTDEGKAQLEASKGRIDALFERLEQTGRGFERGRSPELMKAFMNLRGAVGARVSRESVKPEQIEKMVEAINAAAKAIDEL